MTAQQEERKIKVVINWPSGRKSRIPRRTAVVRFYLIGLVVICLTVSSSVTAQSTANRPFNPFNPRNLRFDFSVPATRPISMGGAAIALADDPSAANINPAGVALFTKPALSIGTRINQSRVEEPDGNVDNPGVVEQKSEFIFDHNSLTTIVPIKSIRISTFRETVYDSRFSYINPTSLIVPAASGLTDQRDLYRQNFPTVQRELRMQIIDNGGSLAWRLSDKLNFGFSLRLTRLEYDLVEREYFENDIPNLNSPGVVFNSVSADNLYLVRTVNNNDWGVGYNFGFLSKLSDRLSMGLVFNHRPTFNLDTRIFLPRYSGAGVFTGRSFAAQEQDSTFNVRFDMPDSYGLGLAYKYRGWLNIVADIIRFEYEEMVSGSSDGSSTQLTNLIQDDDRFDGRDPENADDIGLDSAWEFHIGMEYIHKFAESGHRLPLRIGYYYEPGHVISAEDTKPNLQAAFPGEGSSHHFTGGLGFFIQGKLRFDTAFNISDRSIQILGSTAYVF